MKRLNVILVVLGAMIWGLGAGVASAAPASSLIPNIAAEIPAPQSLLQDVRHRAYCHWHRSCGYKYRCWWRNGYRRCGTRWTCRSWCHRHYFRHYGYRPRVQLYLNF